VEGLSAHVVRGLGAGVALGCMVLARFPYKLTLWVRVSPLTYLCIDFWPIFLINWLFSLLFNEKVELLVVAKKKPTVLPTVTID
jgi:hypothetical protein